MILNVIRITYCFPLREIDGLKTKKILTSIGLYPFGP